MMQQCGDLETFYRTNHPDLLRCIAARTWGASKEDREDIASCFYDLLIKNKTLTNYDPKKGKWSSWILMVVDWSIRAVMLRKHKTEELTEAIEDHHDDELRMKILDFRAWILKHGGLHKKSLAAMLRDKVTGVPTWDKYTYWQNTQYGKLSIDFLKADSTVIAA
jgi:hypothetical protein